MTLDPSQLGPAIRALPGLDTVLEALAGLAPTYLVGGAVRDLLRGAGGVDLDVAVEGDARATARALAERLGGVAIEHERFGTATVRAGALTLDLATTRRERYPRPGALPEVEPAALADDLRRRDFTVNAMAAALAPERIGELHDPYGGLSDLEAGVIRVLHGNSFVDDPTRLLRAVRYEIRLGAAMDDETERLAREVVAAGALGTVSGPRVRDELLDLLAEPDVAAGVARLGDLGLDRALDSALRADPDLVAAAALGSAETGADRVLAALAALAASASVPPDRWLDALGLGADERSRVARAARRGRELADALRAELPASELHGLLASEPPEALALALGMGAPADPVLRFVADLRGARLEITGADLLAAGIPESPAVGRALSETLRRKLDGRVSGRDEELRVALEVAREAGP